MYVKKTNRITSKCTDWTRYVGILADREDKISQESLSSMSEEDRYNRVVDTIKKATFEATGKRWMISEGTVVKYVNPGYRQGSFGGRGRNRNPVEWWDSECDRLVKNRRKVCKEYKKDKCTAKRVEKKRCEALVRRAVRQKKKRENFRTFAESLGRFADMRYVWRRMNVFKNRQNTEMECLRGP